MHSDLPDSFLGTTLPAVSSIYNHSQCLCQEQSTSCPLIPSPSSADSWKTILNCIQRMCRVNTRQFPGASCSPQVRGSAVEDSLRPGDRALPGSAGFQRYNPLLSMRLQCARLCMCFQLAEHPGWDVQRDFCVVISHKTHRKLDLWEMWSEFKMKKH